MEKRTENNPRNTSLPNAQQTKNGKYKCFVPTDKRNFTQKSYTPMEIFNYIWIIVIFAWCTVLAIFIGPTELLILAYIGTGAIIALIDVIYCISVCCKRSKINQEDAQNTEKQANELVELGLVSINNLESERETSLE